MATPRLITFPFKRELLKQCLVFASQDETRLALNGVCLEIAIGAPILLVASDGRRLVAHQTDWQHTYEGGRTLSCIVPTRLITLLPEEGYFPSQICVIHESMQVEFDFPDFKISGRLIEAQYPSWRTVLPNPMPTTFPAKRFVGSALFLQDVLTFIGDVERRAQAAEVLGTDDPGDPLIVKYSHGHILLMPMKS